MPPIGTPYDHAAQDNGVNANGWVSHAATGRRATDSRPSANGDYDPNDRRKMSGFVQNVRKAAESSPSSSGQAPQTVRRDHLVAKSLL